MEGFEIMKPLEKGQDKIDKICDALRRQTLEPAEIQAAKIIEEANQQAKSMILHAEKRADEICLEAQKQVEKDKHIFQSSLGQAAKEAVEHLRQTIENQLFNPELESEVRNASKDPKIIAMIINALVEAIEKRGFSADLLAYIPKNISPRTVSAILLDGVLKKLGEEGIDVGDFYGGAKIKIVNRKMTLDMSDEALKELLGQFVRKDLRKFLFNN